MSVEYTIRRMLPTDAEAVFEIEKANFSIPWPLADFRSDCTDAAYCFLVAENQGEILGYVGMRSVLDEADITTIAVKTEVKGCGIGRGLMRAAEAECRARGVVLLQLEVRESNRAARKLYESEGFRVNGIRKRYYREPEEDAVLMSLQIPDSSFH